MQVALQLGSGQVHDFHHLLTACLKETAPASYACYVFLLLRHVKTPQQQQGYRQAVCQQPSMMTVFMHACMHAHES